MKRIGIDVGGTFTDVVLVDEVAGRVWSVKVPTTPRNPAIGTVDGVREILRISRERPGAVEFIGHGTTIATNMLIENKGARTALVTSRGFRDVLEIRRLYRHDRADLYDMHFANPPALVPRRFRREVDERVLYTGAVERALRPEEVDEVVDALVREGVEAVAICFLNAHVNASHEATAAARARARGRPLYVTASSEVNPEMGEYERTSTTVVNALLGPRTAGYVSRLDDALRQEGVTAATHLMQSNGGLTSLEGAIARPAALVESGPAGGVIAVASLCRELGYPNAITGDMGGTSFDVAVIRDGRPDLRTESLVSTWPVRVPTLHIESIGAGGGSIVWRDEGGALRVGPRSAGADPGPVCYKRGGTQPTVTDGNVILGHLAPDYFLGGRMTLDADGAREALQREIAGPLGLSVEDAAQAARQIVNALMAQAIRLVTVERGYDVRDFCFVAFGGAGPLHATDLAQELGIRTVIVPFLPGLTSALGMVLSDIVHDYQAAVLRNVGAVDPDRVEAEFARMERTARATLASERVADTAMEFRRSADLRYLGQLETINVLVGPGTGPAVLKQLVADFHLEHQRLWNFTMEDRPVTILNLRLTAVGRVPRLALPPLPASTGDAGQARKGRRRLYLEHRWQEVPVYDRERLQPGHRIEGPAVIEEESSTLTIAAGQVTEVDPRRHLIVRL